MELTTAEKQFLMLLRSIKKYPKDSKTGEELISNLENLKKRGESALIHKLDSMTFNEETITNLLNNGLMEQLETTFQLTSIGEDIAKRARKEFLDEIYSEIFRQYNASKILTTVTKQVHGKDLGQLSMMTMPQLNKLLELLQLTPDDSVLDLGCGIGKITEYIFDLTQANIVGIDIASEAVELAQKRTENKRDKLEFRVDDMDDLSIPPASVDCIIAIDTLYFVEELEDTIGQMKTLLKPQGRMGLFYSESCLPTESKDKLQPDNTKLSLALQKHGLKYQTFDFTVEEKDFWNKANQLYRKHKDDFEQEGNLTLYEGLYQETEYLVEVYKEERASRHLYFVTK